MRRLTKTMANLKYVLRRIRTCSLILLGGLAAFALAVPSFGDTLTYSFTATPGNAGTAMKTFSSDGVNITVTGFAVAGTTEQLFFRRGDDIGLGLARTIHHEIAGTAFVQVDLSQLWAQKPTSASLNLSSVDPGEFFDVWGSNVAGTPGILLMSHISASQVNLIGFSGFQFISVSAPQGSVLLSTIKASDSPSDPISPPPSTPVSTPEPGILTLLALALTCAGFIAYRWGSHDLTQA